jgi:hypothetical protein
LPRFFSVAFLFSSRCGAQKYVENGDYDSTIDFCIRKLKGKPKKKEEYVKGLELAFRKAQARSCQQEFCNLPSKNIPSPPR